MESFDTGTSVGDKGRGKTRITCMTCKYWQKTSEGDEKRQAYGECRRNAPTVSWLKYETGYTYEVNAVATNADYWCGEAA